MTEQITLEDLTDEQIEAVLNSRGFQKMLAYRRLAQGIEVLEDEDEIFDSMVNSILNQHSTVQSKASVEEFFNLFRDEVKTFTEPLVDEGGEELDAGDLDDIYADREEE